MLGLGALCCRRGGSLYLRGRDDNFCVNELLVERGVLALLIRSRDESVAVLLEPLADAELVLRRS